MCLKIVWWFAVDGMRREASLAHMSEKCGERDGRNNLRKEKPSPPSLTYFFRNSGSGSSRQSSRLIMELPNPHLVLAASLTCTHGLRPAPPPATFTCYLLQQ
jgi:hypothetical protein